MADYTTELDCVRTFLLAVHTVSTTKHYPVEASKLSGITDATMQRMLVYPPEIMVAYSSRVIKRYKVEIEEPSEAGLTTAINNIQIGREKSNRRTTIASWTKPATWCHVKIANGSQIEAKSKSGIWQCSIWLDVERATA